MIKENKTEQIVAHVTPTTRRKFKAIAENLGMSESTLANAVIVLYVAGKPADNALEHSAVKPRGIRSRSGPRPAGQ